MSDSPRTLLLITAAAPEIRRVRRRPIAEVAAEYGSFRGKVIIFWDDNLANDRKYAKQLFRALTPHKKWWSSHWTKYNGRQDVVFQPRHMSPQTLLEGFQHANRRFYFAPSIYRRLTHSPVGLWWTLPLNVAYACALRRG